jgi:hypothetical protein
MYENRFYFIFSFYKGQGNVCAKCRLQKVKRGRLCGGEAGMREREKGEAVWRRGGNEREREGGGCVAERQEREREREGGGYVAERRDQVL